MAEFLSALILSSISGTIIAFLLILGRPLLKDKISKRSQYYSWLAVFFRMLFPFSIGGLFAFAPHLPLQIAPVADLASAANEAVASAADSLISANSAQVSGFSFVSILFSVWLFGMLGFMTVHVMGYIRYARRIKNSCIAVTDAVTLELLEDCRLKLDLPHALPLYVSSLVDTPMLFKLMRYSIILPDKSFTPLQLKHAFLHELVHARQHDNLWKWAAVLATSIHWFNPAAFFAAKEFNRQCELSCDETAVSDFSREERIDYGKTLLSVASRAISKPYALSSSMGTEKRNLKERLEVLVNMKKKNTQRVILSSLVLLFVAVLALLTVMLSGVNQVSAKERAVISSFSNSGGSSLFQSANSSKQKWVSLDRLRYVEGTIQSIQANSDSTATLYLKVIKNYKSAADPVDDPNYPYQTGASVSFIIQGTNGMDIQQGNDIVLYAGTMSTESGLDQFNGAAVMYLKTDSGYVNSVGQAVTMPPAEYPDFDQVSH